MDSTLQLHNIFIPSMILPKLQRLPKFSQLTTELRHRIIFSIILGIIGVSAVIVGGAFYTLLVTTLFGIGFYEFYSIISSVTDEKKHTKLLKIGIACIGTVWVSLIYLRFCNNGFLLTIWIAFAVWSFDIAAYGFGRYFKGPKLIPSISPNKTWSGFLGGALFSGLISSSIYVLFNFGTRFRYFAILSFIIPFVSQAGDIIESKFKRTFGVKDSGKLIPGHGGILDRMDGFLIVAPLFAIINIIASIFGNGIFYA